uniref:Uncharacterized protein n=1 Tax=Arundo donax TaxID=35708 RepID=A0A0A9C7F6_ARUDO
MSKGQSVTSSHKLNQNTIRFTQTNEAISCLSTLKI